MKRFIRPAVCVLLLISTVLCAVSCMRVSAAELSAGIEGKYKGGEADPDGFSDVYRDFSFKLLSSRANEGENVLISPLSALVCTALIENGADGNTKKQLEDVIGCGTDELNTGLYNMISSIRSYDECKIKTANSIWIKEDFKVKQTYLQKNADFFGAQIYSAPFDKTTLNDVNVWAEKQTDGLIKNALDSMPGDTVLILINSLLFDGKWQEKYENKDVRDREFHNEDGTVKTLPFLSSEETDYIEGEGFSAFAKDYRGGGYCFIGILPYEGADFEEFLRSFDGEKWKNAWEARERHTVHVNMPEFSYDDETDLKKIFSSIGVTDVFDPLASDLSGISDESLYCSGFFQKTRIEHDRNGTKAAAITIGLVGNSGAEPRTVTLDRPFVYMIADKTTGQPLFIGAVRSL